MTSPSGIQLFDGMFTGLEQVLDVRRVQHTLLASNLANANTPNYRAKQIPFDRLLTEVMDGAIDGSVDGTDVTGTDLASAAMEEVEPLPWSTDGNSVDAEKSATELTANSVLYNALGTSVSRRLAILRFAASDGKG